MTHQSKLKLTLILAFLALLGVPMAALSQSSTGVGFRKITIPNPVGDGTMPGYVFYPSAMARGTTWIGPYKLHATQDAPPIPGTKPLVVISHGHGGSDLSHHDLATYLASHGFVVGTLTHPKDNYIDSSGNGHVDVEIGRPIQVSATITYLLHDPQFKTLIDPDRIGAAGFSAGGYTVLMLVGAVPDFARLIGYCRVHPGDKVICGVVRHLKTEAAQHGKTIIQAMDVLQNNLHRWGNTDDPRVKAAFAMAPFSLVFDRAGLSHVDRPVYLYYGQDDHELRPRYNVLHVAHLLKTLSGITMIPKAGHYVFLSPCSSVLAKQAPGICKDPTGVNRVAVHRRINATALAFFRKALKVKHDFNGDGGS